MGTASLAELVQERMLDPEAAALAWLLLEGGVPLVVSGSADLDVRRRMAMALLDCVPGRAWVLLDADEAALAVERLSAIIQGGVGLGITLAARDLRAMLERLGAPDGLPDDVVRRLGLVVIVAPTPSGVRVVAMHFLRPTERDGQGHLQRRPPAVLTTWDADAGIHEHFAWGVMPELADHVDRSQADLEERQRDRAAFIERQLAREGSWHAAADAYLAEEPARVPAPARASARPSPFGGGLTDPDAHVH